MATAPSGMIPSSRSAGPRRGDVVPRTVTSWSAWMRFKSISWRKSPPFEGGVSAPKAQTGWFVQATDYLDHPACSQGSQAPLLQKEGICSNLDALSLGEILRFCVTGVGVTGDPDSGIIRQHTIEALRHFLCSIRDDDLAGVQGIA